MCSKGIEGGARSTYMFLIGVHAALLLFEDAQFFEAFPRLMCLVKLALTFAVFPVFVKDKQKVFGEEALGVLGRVLIVRWLPVIIIF